jgi:hypothetical protein
MEVVDRTRDWCHRLQLLAATSIAVLLTVVFVPWEEIREKISGARQRELHSLEFPLRDGISLHTTLLQADLSWKERVRWLCQHILRSPPAESCISRDAMVTEFDEWSLLPSTDQDERLLFLTQLLGDSIGKGEPTLESAEANKRIIQLATDCATWPVATPNQRKIRTASTELIQRIASTRKP